MHPECAAACVCQPKTRFHFHFLYLHLTSSSYSFDRLDGHFEIENAIVLETHVCIFGTYLTGFSCSSIFHSYLQCVLCTVKEVNILQSKLLA